MQRCFDPSLKVEFHGQFGFWVDLAAKSVKNTSVYCSSREILVLSQHWKAWLRSQAFNPPYCRRINMGNVE